MNPIRLAQVLAMVSALALPAGCMTTGGKGAISVNTVEGAYKAPVSNSLPNDIKEILTAGGLDTRDPSAPGSDTEIAEMATSVSPGRKVDTLVARLEGGNPSPAPQPAPAEAKSDPSVFAMAEAKKASPAAAAVAALDVPDNVKTVTVRYPDIGVASPPLESPVVAAAMAPSGKHEPKAAPRESRRRAAAAVPSPETEAKKRRF